MRIQDEVILALALWRENRGGGMEGMQSVANVVMNRAAQRKTNAYTECTRAQQFSSITAKGDPELNLWAKDGDTQWRMALDIAARAATGVLVDITSGADLYYAPHSISPYKPITLPNGIEIPFPAHWDASAVVYTGTIQGQVFFRSV